MLTVSVSVVAGVEAVVSAVPGVDHHRVSLALLFIAMVAWSHLRGVRDSGQIFAIPTYLFIGSIGALLAVAALEATTDHPLDGRGDRWRRRVVSIRSTPFAWGGRPPRRVSRTPA